MKYIEHKTKKSSFMSNELAMDKKQLNAIKGGGDCKLNSVYKKTITFVDYGDKN